MESRILQTGNRVVRVGVKRPARMALLLVPLLLCDPALADPVAPPGSITYIREVPLRRADQPGEPGDVHAVRTAPTEVIFGATGLAVSHLSDAEVGAISAEAGTLTSVAVGTAMDSVHTALGGSGGSGSSNLDANVMGSSFSSTITGAIGSSTSAIRGAIGSALSALTGKSQ